MAQTSPAKIKVTAINQVGLPVKDLNKGVKDYWNILGIGPHVILTMELPHAYDLTYRGKPANYKYDVSLAQVGPVQFELVQRFEGHTIYEDFIAEHGEGANHMEYLVDSVEEMDRHTEIMSQKGFPVLMGGRLGSNGCFAYYDTASILKTLWEPGKLPDEPYGGPTVVYPPNESEVSPARIKVKAITQIGIAVKNLKEVMENYWNILGIGPWDILECAPPTFHNITYHGKPVNSKWRAALTNVGRVQLGLFQPVSGDNIYSDFIRERGEGIHHIQFQVDDIKETNRIMEAEGFPVLMGGGLIDGGFAYYNTVEPLKIIWEAFQPPRAMPRMAHYP